MFLDIYFISSEPRPKIYKTLFYKLHFKGLGWVFFEVYFEIFYHEIKCMSKSTVIFALGIFWRQTITKTLNNTGQVLKGIWGQRVLIKYKFNRTSFWAKLVVENKLFLLEFFGSLYLIA